MVLAQPEGGVVDQELPYLLLPERERQAARNALVGEVLAVGDVARAGLAVPEVERLVVSLEPARVVVDDVEHHRDPVEVTQVDQRLQLIDAAGDLTRGERRQTLGREQAVDRGEVPAKHRRVVDGVERVGREVVGAVVSGARVGLGLGDRQRLKDVDPEGREIRDLLDHVEVRPVARRRRRVRPDVKLVDNHVREIGRRERRVVPGIGRRRPDHAVDVERKRRARGQLAGVRIALVPRASAGRPDDPEFVDVAVGDAREKPRPVASGVSREQVGTGRRRPVGDAAEGAVQVHGSGRRGPHLEGRAAGDQRRAHRGIGREVRLRERGHVLRTPCSRSSVSGGP